MNTSYICSGCRRRLRQLRPGGIVLTQPRAGFISLSRRAPQTDTGDKLSDDLAESTGNIGSHNGEKSGRSKSGSPATIPGDMLETLFEESLKPQSTFSDKPLQPFAVFEPYKNADVLRKLLAQGGNAADSWYFFLEHFGPDAQKDPFNRRRAPSYVTTAAKELVKETIAEKHKKPFSETLPSVTEVSRVLVQYVCSLVAKYLLIAL